MPQAYDQAVDQTIRLYEGDIHALAFLWVILLVVTWITWIVSVERKNKR